MRNVLYWMTGIVALAGAGAWLFLQQPQFGRLPEAARLALIPAHVCRFVLARHAWDEPFQRIFAAREGKSYRLLTPMIGEAVNLSSDNPGSFSPWW